METNREHVRWADVDPEEIETSEECRRMMRILEVDRDRVAQTIARWRDTGVHFDLSKFRRTEDAAKGMKRKYVALQARSAS